jgi:hypothetical protein
MIAAETVQLQLSAAACYCYCCRELCNTWKQPFYLSEPTDHVEVDVDSTCAASSIRRMLNSAGTGVHCSELLCEADMKKYKTQLRPEIWEG